MKDRFNNRPHDLTDETVERLVPQGGVFRIARDQCSETQGPGGFDVVIVTKNGVQKNTIVPKTDSFPQTEGPDVVVWKRNDKRRR